jgi:hypothetical protein
MVRNMFSEKRMGWAFGFATGYAFFTGGIYLISYLGRSHLLEAPFAIPAIALGITLCGHAIQRWTGRWP